MKNNYDEDVEKISSRLRCHQILFTSDEQGTYHSEPKEIIVSGKLEIYQRRENYTFARNQNLIVWISLMFKIN